MYLTGGLITTNDPLNVYMENIYIDSYYYSTGMMFVTLCNYPEAYLTPSIVMKNLTADTFDSSEIVDFRSPFLFYTGPGNFTGENFNTTNFFNLASSGTASGVLGFTTV